MAVTVYRAPDIECEGCANAIKKALGNVPGIETVNVNVDAKTVEVNSTEMVSESLVISALDRAGFPATRA